MADPNIIGGLLGGALIGISACLLLWLNGRIAGISGILGGLVVARANGDWRWRLAFVLGLIAGAGLYGFLLGPLPLKIEADAGTVMLAGFLVGVGTRLGSGCTSGHGVCGLARRSPRSLAATLVFMACGVATVYLVRHLIT
jgi:uncharacterized membrane protein YedE/YeeE